jgi:nucleoside-diphosphate-sugar epimerase
LEKLIIASGLSGTIGGHLHGFQALTSRAESSLKDDLFPVGLNFDYLHLAAIVDNALLGYDMAQARDVNIFWPARLATDFLRTGSRGKFVFLSTGQVYGLRAVDVSEDCSTDPLNLYASLKLEAEAELLKIFVDKPDQLIIVRLFSVLSPRGKAFTLGGRIMNALSMPLGSKVRFFDPESVRDFINGQALQFYLERIIQSDTFGLLNLGSGKSRTVRSAVEKVFVDSGYDASFISWDISQGSSYMTPNLAKLNAAIGSEDSGSGSWSWKEHIPT